MSNCIYFIAKREKNDLSGFIRDFKRHTGHKFLQKIDENYEDRRDWLKVVFEYHGKYKNKQTSQIWYHGSYAEKIYNQEHLKQKINFIHYNPVRAGIVEIPEHYIYSSARNYAGLESVINITPVNID